MQALDKVEDELVSMLREAEKLAASLRDLDEREAEALASCTAVLSHLDKAQHGILNHIESLKDYLPYERTARESRVRARLARSDCVAARSSLEMTLDAYNQDRNYDSENEDEYTPPPSSLLDKGNKRARRE